MVCLRNICVNTLHKGDSIFTNNNNNNNNNNVENQFFIVGVLAQKPYGPLPSEHRELALVGNNK
jgi:hypothetical protein